MAPLTDILVAVAGGVYVLLVPGLVLSFAFFQRRTIDWLERLALSFALSVAVVPLVAFYLNMLGVRITRWSVVLEVLGVILVGGGVVWWRARRSRGGRLKPPDTPKATIKTAVPEEPVTPQAPGRPPGPKPTPASPRARRSIDAVGRRNR